MAVTVWTDAYATVAQMDTLLRANNKWQGLQARLATNDDPDPTDTDGIAKKEAYLKAAAQAIDNAARIWDGSLVSDSQALKFPRDFGAATGDPLFTTAAQLRELVTATAMQINADLANEYFGTAPYDSSVGGSTPPAYPQVYGMAAPAVVRRLMVYARRSL